MDLNLDDAQRDYMAGAENLTPPLPSWNQSVYDAQPTLHQLQSFHMDMDTYPNAGGSSSSSSTTATSNGGPYTFRYYSLSNTNNEPGVGSSSHSAIPATSSGLRGGGPPSSSTSPTTKELYDMAYLDYSAFNNNSNPMVDTSVALATAPSSSGLRGDPGPSSSSTSAKTQELYDITYSTFTNNFNPMVGSSLASATAPSSNGLHGGDISSSSSSPRKKELFADYEHDLDRNLYPLPYPSSSSYPSSSDWIQYQEPTSAWSPLAEGSSSSQQYQHDRQLPSFSDNFGSYQPREGAEIMDFGAERPDFGSQYGGGAGSSDAAGASTSSGLAFSSGSNLKRKRQTSPELDNYLSFEHPTEFGSDMPPRSSQHADSDDEINQFLFNESDDTPSSSQLSNKGKGKQKQRYVTPDPSSIIDITDSPPIPTGTSLSNGTTTTAPKSKVPSKPPQEPLSAFTCPICFSPPTNATLTPCGHICCGECLFTAVKTTMQRGMMTAVPDAGAARCPVCRATIAGWDGKGGGVIGLKPRAIFSL